MTLFQQFKKLLPAKIFGTLSKLKSENFRFQHLHPKRFALDAVCQIKIYFIDWAQTNLLIIK